MKGQKQGSIEKERTETRDHREGKDRNKESKCVIARLTFVNVRSKQLRISSNRQIIRPRFDAQK